MSFEGIPSDWLGYARYGFSGLFRKKKDKWGDPVLIPGWTQVVGDLPHPQKAEVTNSMAHNRCYFCGQQRLMDGPRGGLPVNVVCAACGAKFNDTGAIGCDVLRGPTDPIPERIKGEENRPATHHPNLTGVDLEGLMAR